MNRITSETPAAPAFGPTPSAEYKKAMEAIITKLEALHIKLFEHAEKQIKFPHGFKFVDDIQAVDKALAGVLKGLE